MGTVCRGLGVGERGALRGSLARAAGGDGGWQRRLGARTSLQVEAKEGEPGRGRKHRKWTLSLGALDHFTDWEERSFDINEGDRGVTCLEQSL